MKLSTIAKQILNEETIAPPDIPNTMSFYHGGNLNQYDDVIAQKNGRYEFGPGLYITTHYGTIEKYAKGSRKRYMITVEKGTNIRDAELDTNIAVDFIKSYCLTSKRKEVLQYLQQYIKNDKVPAYIFNNLILNHTAIKPAYTKYLRQFYIDNGIDYELIDNAFGWGEVMMVLYNMKKIVQVKQIMPKDVVRDMMIKNK